MQTKEYKAEGKRFLNMTKHDSQNHKQSRLWLASCPVLQRLKTSPSKWNILSFYQVGKTITLTNLRYNSCPTPSNLFLLSESSCHCRTIADIGHHLRVTHLSHGSFYSKMEQVGLYTDMVCHAATYRRKKSPGTAPPVPFLNKRNHGTGASLLTQLNRGMAIDRAEKDCCGWGVSCTWCSSVRLFYPPR